MKVYLFPLDRIAGEHVHFIFVMNFGKFVLYFCCYFWISYSSLKGEFDVFSYGVFSSYKNTGQCFSLSGPGKRRNIWFQYLPL